MSATGPAASGYPWVAVGEMSAIDPDYPVMATVGEIELVVCRVGDEAFALGNICTHAYARLSDGHVEDEQVFCPLHQGSFNLRTGEAVALPCYEPIATFPTRVEGDTILVDVTGGAS